MDYQITTPPTHEPVSLEQAKRHLRVDDAESDALIRSYLRAARAWCEDYAGRAFCRQTITLKMSSFPAAIQIPRPPLVAVSSITYVDTAGATQTVASTVYDVDTTSEPGKVLLAYDQDWPNPIGHHHDVTLTCLAGHTAAFTRSGNTLLVPGHRFCDGDFVQVYNSGGALPAGLSEGTDYYVTAVSGTAISLAASEGGGVIALSDDGTGTHTIDAVPEEFVNAILLLVGDWYANREDIVTGTIVSHIPTGVKVLLGMKRMVAT